MMAEEYKLRAAEAQALLPGTEPSNRDTWSKNEAGSAVVQQQQQRQPSGERGGEKTPGGPEGSQRLLDRISAPRGVSLLKNELIIIGWDKLLLAI